MELVDGFASFGGDADLTGAFVGFAGGTGEVAVALETLEGAAGVGAVDVELGGEGVLGRFPALVVEERQETGLGVVEADGGEVAFGELEAAAGEVADAVEEGVETVQDLFSFDRRAPCSLFCACARIYQKG